MLKLNEKFYFCLLLSSILTYTKVEAQQELQQQFKGSSFEELMAQNNFKPACTEKIKNQIMASQDSRLNLNCSLHLKSHEILNRNIIIKGEENSNILIYCEKGAEIGPVKVMSEKRDKKTGVVLAPDADPSLARWSRPSHILVQGCSLKGIRVSGIKEEGVAHDDDMRYSSYFANHTENSQQSAPTNVTFKNNTVTVSGPVAVYIDMGVTNFNLIGNTLNGQTQGVVMYLDAESAYNTIEGNTFNINSVITSVLKGEKRMRETIAIDGSAHNKIINNKFIGRNLGGIHIYRNCGEKGLVRHQTPQFNLISGNEFINGSIRNFNDIVVDSRPKTDADDVSFCWQDKKVSLDELYAMIKKEVPNYQEKFPTRDSVYLVKLKDLPVSVRNKIAEAPVYPFGSSLENDGFVAQNRIVNNKLTTPVGGEVKDLQNNEIKNNTILVSGLCRKNQSNEGCQFELQCPQGMIARSVKAACNLEFGTIPNDVFAQVKPNRVQIVKDSGAVESRMCNAGGIKVKKMSMPLDKILGQNLYAFSCYDQEADGGDCAIRAAIECVEK